MPDIFFCILLWKKRVFILVSCRQDYQIKHFFCSIHKSDLFPFACNNATLWYKTLVVNKIQHLSTFIYETFVEICIIPPFWYPMPLVGYEGPCCHPLANPGNSWLTTD